jgi:saccharopine dehydrogenase-like NADP-dependent oxidoreductase
MQHILVFGAGRSATSLIQYFLENASQHEWQITVADYDLAMAEQKVRGWARGTAVQIDIQNTEERRKLIAAADIVVSLLPVNFHHLVAIDCIELGKNLTTASYVSPEMKALDAEVKAKGLTFLNECGLDPGIDHMSAMQVIDRIKSEGHQLKTFESFAGGLLAPGTDDFNPWEYKFTWNPRNVVLAGQGVVKFIQEGKYKYIPYPKVFRRTEMVHIPGYGYFEGYANRDSMKYLDVYHLQGISTLYRGTFRRPGFCRTWDVFVQIGATDDTYQMERVDKMTHRDFINSFLLYHPHDSVELKLAYYLGLDMEGPEMHRLRWVGMFDETPVGLEKGTPAQILEHILKKKWSLNPEDRDMIVMWNKFEFFDQGRLRELHSTFIALGDDATHTAMAKTVGLPLAIGTKLILQGKIDMKGVQIPIHREWYEPILTELKALGFEMRETEKKV